MAGLAFGGPVLAAMTFTVLVQPATVADGPALVATLADADGKPLIANAYDQSTDGKVPELWVIKGKDPPRSLGVIDIAAGRSQAIPRERLAGLKPGVVLAIWSNPWAVRLAPRLQGR